MGVLPMQVPEFEFIQSIFSVAILIFSVVAHEVSHGYMAQYLGDPTARLAGRLTMNPVKHIDPLGSVIVPLLTIISQTGFVFGWAKPVPYNPYNLRDQKWGDSKVALAGPMTNFAIALVFAFIIRMGGEFFTPAMQHLMVEIVLINIILAVFNVVPIPPLDGSKLLANALPFRYQYIYQYLERYSLVLILFFAFFLWKLFLPLIYGILGLLIGGTVVG